MKTYLIVLSFGLFTLPAQAFIAMPGGGGGSECVRIFYFRPKVTKYADGTKKTKYRRGPIITETEYPLESEKRVVTEYRNGLKKTKYKDGRIKTEHPSGPEKRTVIEYVDGRRKTKLPDGEIKIEYPGERIETRMPSGDIITEYPGGMRVIKGPDGHIVREHPSGLIVTEHVDGRRTKQYSNVVRNDKYAKHDKTGITNSINRIPWDMLHMAIYKSE